MNARTRPLPNHNSIFIYTPSHRQHFFLKHNQLQEQAEYFVAAADLEKRNIETFAEQTALMKHKILKQRKMMGGVNAAKENEFMVQKQVREALSGRGDDNTPSPDVLQDSVPVSSAEPHVWKDTPRNIPENGRKACWSSITPVIYCHK